MSALPLSPSLDAVPSRRPLRRLGQHVADGLARRPRRIWLFAFALIAVASVISARQIIVERADEIARVEARAHLAAVMITAHLERIFDLADANLQSLDRTPESRSLTVEGDAQDLGRWLGTLVGPGRLFSAIAVTDAEGRVVARDREAPDLAPDLSNQPYFLHHRANRAADLLISAPVRARAGRTATVPVSRRLETRSGAFVGVVVARLPADQLIDLYRALGTISISAHLLDGTTLAGTSFAELKDAAFSPKDDAKLILGHARLDHRPVMVTIGLDRDAALTPWRKSRDGTLVLTLVFILTVAGAFLALERQLHALAQARFAAEAADRAKSNFLAHMSHELRTPLNAVIGFAEIMGHEVFGPLGDHRYTSYVRDIHLSGEHLLAIINNVLDLAKVSAGRWQVDLRIVSPSEVATDIRRILAAEADSRRVTFELELAPGVPPIRCDRRMLNQILLNLASNALKFTPEGGTVCLKVGLANGRLVFEMADNGIGMTPDEVQRALEPFADDDSPLTRKANERGLGLPLARAFAELLGGRLRIESTPGYGTKATLVLPIGNRSENDGEEWRARRDSNSQPSDP
jgi:signal transduction histidine kinase